MRNFLNWLVDALLILVTAALMLLIADLELGFGDRASLVIKAVACAVLVGLGLAALLDALRPGPERKPQPKRKSRAQSKSARSPKDRTGGESTGKKTGGRSTRNRSRRRERK